MDVVILLVFISLGLVAASLFFFVHRLAAGDFDHAERLALAPLDDDSPLSSDDPPPSSDDPALTAADADDARADDPSETREPSSERPQSPERLQGGSTHARS